MRVLFCTPFKPLDHPRLSGDVTIARDLFNFLADRGHSMHHAPCSETTRFPWQPDKWPGIWNARRQATSIAAQPQHQFSAWLTYSSYYKAPDLFGPIAAQHGIPYFIFSPAYAKKRRKKLRSLPGYLVNKQALQAADHLFVNKRTDIASCQRIVPTERVTYVRPGIPAHTFSPTPEGRAQWRSAWRADDRVIISTAAIMRPGVKVEGLKWVIRACAELVRQGRDILLAIAGDGPGRADVELLAADLMPRRTRFAGVVERNKLNEFFSAGDLFAFPGINEGLGMVYLEAQCCGLPAIAWDHAGAPEVVAHEQGGGLITPSFDLPAFVQAMDTLVSNISLRREMGRKARQFVLDYHDTTTCYLPVENIMQDITARKTRMT